MGDLHGARLAKVVGLVGGGCMFLIAFVCVVMLRSPDMSPPSGYATAEIKPASQSAGTPVQTARPVQNEASAAAPVVPAGSSAPAAAEQRLAALPQHVEQVGQDADAATPADETGPRVGTVSVTTTTGRGAPAADTAGPAVAGERGLVILQIGDSHTSADFLTGELRKRLQQRYGSGGVGYITAGHPHIGVRSAALKVGVSPGWTYRAIQKSDNISEFWLSGFNTVTSAPGEALTFSSETPVVFDSIEIEAMRQPGGGSIDISMDGSLKNTFDLDAKKPEPIVLRFKPDGAPTDRVRQIEIKTRNQGAVSIASIAIYNKQSGVSYNNIGYPGATVDLVNKFDQALMADDLRRLNPQIVVLSFGTNEASKKNLDLAHYEQNYEKVVNKIKAALPAAELVLIGPPDGAERGPHCAGKPPPDSACHPAQSDAAPASTDSTSKSNECDWYTLPKLEGIRNVERKIAERHGFAYWNWASIMPAECGSHRWATASPPLMAKDHIHFTISGYNKSAEQFLDNALIPVIEKVQGKRGFVSSSLSTP
jgi:lysophospholipase L1-like esterase